MSYKLLKKLSKLLTNITKLKNKILFLRRCQDEGIFPKFLNFKIDRINCAHDSRFKENLFDFKLKILHLEISLSEKTLRKLIYNKDFTIGSLSVLINKIELDEFLMFEKIKNERIFNEIKQNNINKINYLIQRSPSLYHKFKKTIDMHIQSWFKNISNTEVPGDFKYIFALGPNFSVPVDCNNKLRHKFMLNFISNFEHSLDNARKKR